jgi:hypothetical protein
MSQPEFIYDESPSGTAGQRPLLAVHKNILYIMPHFSYLGDVQRLYQLFPQTRPGRGQDFGDAELRTAVLPTRGRTNITLVNPVVGHKPDASASASAGGTVQIRYRAGVVYDRAALGWLPLSSSDNPSYDPLTSASTSALQSNEWLSGFGTGRDAQLYFELATSSADDGHIVLYKFEALVEDTGGL